MMPPLWERITQWCAAQWCRAFGHRFTERWRAPMGAWLGSCRRCRRIVEAEEP